MVQTATNMVQMACTDVYDEQQLEELRVVLQGQVALEDRPFQKAELRKLLDRMEAFMDPHHIALPDEPSPGPVEEDPDGPPPLVYAHHSLFSEDDDGPPPLEDEDGPPPLE